MRLVRYTAAGGPASYGLVEGDGGDAVVVRLDGDPFDGVRTTGERTPLADVRLLAPVEPSKVLCLGRNYAEHAKELGNEVPEIPVVFAKFSTSVSTHGPSGQERSKPLARVHCFSARCMSRIVRSLATV